MASTLRLKDELTGTSWRVWPDAEVLPAGAIRELGRYLFELEGAEDAAAADLVIDGSTLEALRAPSPTTARWRWEPGFQAGSVEAELRVPGLGLRRFELITDPDLRKLTRDDFDTMVREILADSLALFSLSGFRKSIARGAGTEPPAIARLEFLRSRVDELERVVGVITKNPRRRLVSDEIVQPYYLARHATGPEILRSMRSGRVLKETGTPSRLPAILQRCMPAQIRTRQKLNTADLQEHRQIGACLRTWSSWLATVSQQLGRRRPQAEDTEAQERRMQWARRCQQLARRIGVLAADPLFSYGGPAKPGLTLTQVFRHDPDYQRFYRLWQDMHRGIAAVFGDFLNMPLARTWELYELWCFVRLLRTAVEMFGQADFTPEGLFKLDAAGGMTISAASVVIPVGKGWHLCFQREYKEFWVEAEGKGSFSRSMRPDIVAFKSPNGGNDQEKLIVLDAKYRINEGLNDALSSVHMYRDALVRDVGAGQVVGVVTAAYLLTPHIGAVAASDYQTEKMPGRLFRPDYRAAFRFGAVTLRPGMSGEAVKATIRTILADIGGGSEFGI